VDDEASMAALNLFLSGGIAVAEREKTTM